MQIAVNIDEKEDPTVSFQIRESTVEVTMTSESVNTYALLM